MKRLKKTIQLFLLTVMIMLFLGIGAVIGIVIAYWNDLPSLEPLEYEAKAWYYPTKVYSDIARITPGMSLKNLIKRLERLDYSKVDVEPTEGQFYLKNPADSSENEMLLYLRKLDYPRFTLPPRLIDIQIRGSKLASVKAGSDLNEFILEPEVIAEFYGNEGTDRELVTLSQAPKTLVQAFIAIEDKRFYKHFGFDLYRIFGALLWDLRHLNRPPQGASTITQQLARDLFLTRERLVTRKIKEALLAIKIEKRYTKDEILERYFNRINLGRYGSREIYGIGQAARYYFGKNVWNLSISEAATLAGIPKDPPKYSPINNPEKSRSRRQLVLKKMREAGFITENEYKEAAASPLMTVPVEDPSSKNVAYALEYIRMQLEGKYEPAALYRQGLKVYTTLDMSIQLMANSAVQKGLNVLDNSLRYLPYDENKAKWSAGERGKKIKSPDSYIQASLVSIEPSTGYVKAMVGGRDFQVSQFNRAVQAQRSPGSAFKPFVYCAAFANKPPLATPVTLITDEPWGVDLPEGRWEPKNFYGRFYGKVTVRKVITKSINVATSRFLYETVGFDRVIDIAKAMGVNSPLAAVPSLGLGASGVTLLEITSAYGVLANQGTLVEPICIKYVLDRENNILQENVPLPKKVMDKNVAFLMTYLMEGVINEGTGSNLREMGFEKPAAGKTGTTNDETDAWFIGFVPDLVTGVWVGFDDFQKSTYHTGATGALPIWFDCMKSALDRPSKDFSVPDGIIFKDVDADTGLPATGRTTDVIREAFLRGNEPG